MSRIGIAVAALLVTAAPATPAGAQAAPDDATGAEPEAAAREPVAATAGSGPSSADVIGPLRFELDGHWRVRGTYLRHLFLGQADFRDVGGTTEDPRDGRVAALADSSFLEHGLRLSPSVAYGERLALELDIDVLDGVIWGDNDAVASTPLFAGSPSSNNRAGERVGTITARRAWVELKLPVGLLKVGRQPSQWGMGLLANAGDGLAEGFGEYRYGSTVDRILFATKPLSIVRALAGSTSTDSSLLVAVAYDKLVTDAVEEQPDPERECAACAPQILLARPGDDVEEIVGVLLYKDEQARLLSDRDLLQAGVYVVHRTQRRTDSRVWIVDGHAKLLVGPAGLETELLWITGVTSALKGESPKKVDIKGGVVRGGYYGEFFDGEVELGYAPGDEDPLDGSFTGYPLHPDHNVGLILYEEVLAARTARVWMRDGRGLWSKGGVVNSRYVQPRLRVRPLKGLTAMVAVLWARADVNDGSVWAENREPREGGDLDLGWEVDLALAYRFWERASFKLEAGTFVPGRALWRDIDSDLLITDADRAAVAYTLQARLGFEL